MINEEIKNKIIENANEQILSEEMLGEITEKRKYFQTEFSKDKLEDLDKDHYFQGRGVHDGNFTYQLEWNSKCLGGIGGGSVYKFGHEEDFDGIKKILTRLLSAKNSFEQFYTADGDLTDFSKEIIDSAGNLRGVSRTLIGKVLSIYYPDFFIGIFGHQEKFLKEIYSDYTPEYVGVEAYLRDNYLLLDYKNKYVPNLTNDEFSHLLYKVMSRREDANLEDVSLDSGDTNQIEALEVQHYQALIHRNFSHLFNNQLKYYDPERQNEVNGHFGTQEVGIMDFLALDKNNDFVVIELKRSSSDQTLGQVLRYMGWVNKNLCDKSQKVKGVIIAESKDNRLEYAMTVVPNVTFKKMKLNVEIEG